jgi:hypothetical protein
VTGLRRFPIIAIAALLAAGCGTNPPSGAPASQTTAPTSTARPSATTGATAAPTATPGTACAPLTEDSWAPSADFSLRIPIGYQNLSLDVTRISSTADQTEVVELEPSEPYLDEPGRLVGRWSVTLIPNIDYDEIVEVPVELISASAILRAPGRDPITMDGALGMDDDLNKPVAHFELPDVNGDVVIDFRVEWADACFTYVAEGPAAFEMVRASYAAQCPSRHNGVAAHWADMQAPPVDVGGVPMPLFRSITIGSWTRYATFVDPVVGFAQWDPALGTVAGRSGATVPVVTGNGDLVLESLGVEYLRRGTILDLLDGGDWPSRSDVLFRATADPFPDGHFELLLPTRPGRYVASVGFDYETPCLSGDGAGAVAIDVE